MRFQTKNNVDFILIANSKVSHRLSFLDMPPLIVRSAGSGYNYEQKRKVDFRVCSQYFMLQQSVTITAYSMNVRCIMNEPTRYNMNHSFVFQLPRAKHNFITHSQQPELNLIKYSTKASYCRSERFGYLRYPEDSNEKDKERKPRLSFQIFV